jgi:hypothetical protein
MIEVGEGDLDRWRPAGYSWKAMNDGPLFQLVSSTFSCYLLLSCSLLMTVLCGQQLPYDFNSHSLKDGEIENCCAIRLFVLCVHFSACRFPL